MKWSEFIKIAQECGYQFVAHGKRHDVYRHPTTGDKLIVERHSSQEIGSGLQSKLLKQLGK